MCRFITSHIVYQIKYRMCVREAGPVWPRPRSSAPGGGELQLLVAGRGGRGRRPLLGGSVSRETVARPGPGVTNTAPASRPVSTSQPPAPAATAGDTGEVEQGRGQGAGWGAGAGGGRLVQWGCVPVGV